MRRAHNVVSYHENTGYHNGGGMRTIAGRIICLKYAQPVVCGNRDIVALNIWLTRPIRAGYVAETAIL